MRRTPLLLVLWLVASTGLKADELRFEPAYPRAGMPVDVVLDASASCPIDLRVQVDPPQSGEGRIEVVRVESCICNSPGAPIRRTIGPLPLGSYRVEARAEAEPAGCRPSIMLDLRHLVVSNQGAVLDLATWPARPVSGEPVTLKLATTCFLRFKAPRFEPGADETRIVVEEDPGGPLPPCFQTYQQDLPLGSLAAGHYLVEVRTGAPAAKEAELPFSVSTVQPVLSLRQGRFQVSAEWSAPGFPLSAASGSALTEESGYLTFGSPSNLEIMVKVLDACSFNHRYWVSIAGLTNLAVSVHVKDVQTGQSKTYTNPLWRDFSTVLDTSAFATCP